MNVFIDLTRLGENGKRTKVYLHGEGYLHRVLISPRAVAILRIEKILFGIRYILHVNDFEIPFPTLEEANLALKKIMNATRMEFIASHSKIQSLRDEP